MIQEKTNEDWHVAYAKLGIVDIALSQKFSEKTAKLLQFYSKFNDGPKAWRVREHAAKIAIFYAAQESVQLRSIAKNVVDEMTHVFQNRLTINSLSKNRN